MDARLDRQHIDETIQKIRALELKKSRRRLLSVVIPLLLGIGLLAISAVFLEQKLAAERMLVRRLKADAEASEKSRASQVRQLEAQLQKQASIQRQLNELQTKISDLEKTNISLKPSTSQLDEVKTTAAEFQNKTRLILLAQRFVGVLAANNAPDLQDIFADKVDYYEFNAMTRQQIQQDLARDRTKWPIRTFTISGDVEQKKLSNSLWELSFPVEYILLNPERQPATGSLKITLICEEPTLRIKAVRREVLKAKKPDG